MAQNRKRGTQAAQETPTSSPKTARDEDVKDEVVTEDDIQEQDTETTEGGDTKAGVKSIGAPEGDESGPLTTEPAEGEAVAATDANAPENAAGGVVNGNPAAWSADGNGNPDKEVAPARPLIGGRTFYPFEYTENSNGTIVADETVYMVVNYPGSNRKGRSLAYNKGTILSAAVLDAIEEPSDKS